MADILDNEKIAYALTHFKLNFEEENPRTHQRYIVTFWPDSVALNDDTRYVFTGMITLSVYPESRGYVEYNKETKIFRRVHYTRSTTKSRALNGVLTMKSHPVVWEEMMRLMFHCEITPTII